MSAAMDPFGEAPGDYLTSPLLFTMKPGIRGRFEFWSFPGEVR